MVDGTVPPPRLKRRLTTLDSFFLYGETASNPMHIGSLAIFEGRIPFEDVLRAVRERIHLLPRYRQRLVEVPFNLAHPTLEDDPDFKLENHVRRCEMPAGLSEAEMLAFALRAYHPMLDRDRPLWEMLWFDRWTGGNTAIVSKTHHALVDGVSGVELIKVMYDFRPDAPPPAAPTREWKPAPLPGAAERLLDAAHDVLGARLDGAFGLARGMVREPRLTAAALAQMVQGLRQLAALGTERIATTPWNAGPVTSGRTFAWLRNSFGEYRAIRSALGGTVNDVVLTVLSEGAARYLKHHGYSTDRPLRIGCPVNVRRPEEMSELGNRVSMMFPTLPAEPMDVVERLKIAHKQTHSILRSGAPHALERLNSLAEAAPAILEAALARAGLTAVEAAAALAQLVNWQPRPGGWLMPAMGINFVATNVPGVQVPQFFCGHRCLDQIGLLPLGGNLGYGVAILSYNGNLYLGMIADPRMVPDIERMKSCVNDAFEELKSAAQARATVSAAAAIEIPAPKARASGPRPVAAPGA